MTNQDNIMKQGFDHPCRETCSGWQQGYDRGKLSYESFRKETDEIIMNLQTKLSLANEKLKIAKSYIENVKELMETCRSKDGLNEIIIVLSDALTQLQSAEAKEEK